MATTNPLLFFDETPGPIEVEILNPRSVVRLGVLSEGDHHVGIGFYPSQDVKAARRFAAALADTDTMDGPAFVMDNGRLTVTLPKVEGPYREDGGIELFVPAGSTVTYRSDSGTFEFRGNWDPRNDWQERAEDEPAPPLNLNYRAENGEAAIIGASGSVDAFDRAGSIYVRTDGGVAKVATSIGSLRANGTGVLSLRAEKSGSRILLDAPCDLDLTVDPGNGVARFGSTFDTGVRLDAGTYHATAAEPPKDSKHLEPPVLTVTPTTPSPRHAQQTASAALAGPPESGRATGQPAVGQERPAGGGPSARVPDRAEGRRPPGA